MIKQAVFPLLGICLLNGVYADAKPDLVPMPKQHEARDGVFISQGKPMFIGGDRQCQVGAEEIASRIKELGGQPGAASPAKDTSLPGIYLLTVSDPAATALIGSHGLNVSEKYPGPQGYIIQATPEQVIIIGSDKIGTLYGAYTFRQMLRSDKAGEVLADAAVVADWPDYKFRSEVGFRPPLTPADAEKQKKLIALWARFKLNILHVNFYMDEDLRDYRQESRALLREVNEYAAARGFYQYFRRTTAVAHAPYDNDIIKGLDGYSQGDVHYSWVRDDLVKASAARVMDFCRECGFKMLFVHPIDGGAIQDPELWSKRGGEARRRWKDDERWKASSHLFNLWAEERETRCPGLILSAPFYPYSPYYGDYGQWNGGVSPEVWRQNSVDYWRKMNGAVDKSWVPMTWMATREVMDAYRACWKDRPVWLYTHSFISTGIFGSWHRIAKTDYEGNAGDIYTLNGGNTTVGTGSWLNPICTGEYTWNVNAPGADNLKGTLYFDAENEFAGPEAVMREWAPRACRALYGAELGNLLSPVFNSGIQPLYIDDPGYGMYLINAFRLNPLGDTAPDTKQKLTKSGLDKVDDSAERMAFQVAATAAALSGLEKALPLIKQLDAERAATLIHYYKRMPLWHMIAKARLACYQSRDACKRGNNREAVTILRKALADYSADLARTAEAIDKAKGEPDTAPLSLAVPAESSMAGVVMIPSAVKSMLEDELASAETVFAPHKVGAIVRIGIFSGLGANGTKAFFDKFRNVKADIIGSLSRSNLAKYDCVFLLQTRSANREDVFGNLKEYVEKGGGGVVFQHDLCGYGRAPWGSLTPFPEISPRIAKYKESRRVKVKARHEAASNLRPGTVLEHMYYDHLSPQVGEMGETVVEDMEGDAVVVVGKAGAGKVVFDGNVNLDAKDQDVELVGANAALAQGAVEWIAGVKLIRE